jgi:predicted DCC family thiol-disulfide oxidoreductase YuxK
MNLVLFDGVCNFCNSTILKIIKYDKKNNLMFSSQQSEYGKTVLKKFRIDENDLNTIYFVKNNTIIYTKSTALIEIIKMLNGKPKLLLIFTIIPTRIRDYFYSVFSKNRYKLFGVKDSCIIPSTEIKNKFID